MASTLQALRRKAGYATARDFADSIGVPFPTYSRYESSPAKIPTAAAWSIADRLGCTIDAVVGRASIDDVELNRGEVQREYDALDPDLRAQMDAYRAYLRWLSAHKKALAKKRSDRAFEQLAHHYEEAMRREHMQESFTRGEFFRPLDGEEARDAFRRFVEELASEKRRAQGGKPDAKGRERDEATVRQLMDAYDRMHDWADRLPSEL